MNPYTYIYELGQGKYYHMLSMRNERMEVLHYNSIAFVGMVVSRNDLATNYVPLIALKD